MDEQDEQNKLYYDKHDIMERYNCGLGYALAILRSIREYCGGGSLPKGKVLPIELDAWEHRQIR